MSEIKRLHKKLTVQPKVCPHCSSKFESSTNTYCSQSCAASVNNSKRKIDKISLPKKNVKTNIGSCLCCSKNLLKSNLKYCSSACQQKYVQDEYIKKWLSGEPVQTTRGSTVSKRIRNYLFEKYDCSCSKCKWCEINPVTGKSPLEVEHIDGDSGNNKPNNLTLLCPNCHSLTATYKALNKGKGRYERMKRYNEGKSY